MGMGKVILIDLPVFPKGVLSLSLINVAACFRKQYDVRIADLNIVTPDWDTLLPGARFIGFKVSAQSFDFAVSITQLIKAKYKGTPVVWGGELPTLLPDVCLEHADTIVSGLFEPVVSDFIADLESCNLKKVYKGPNDGRMQPVPLPDFTMLPNPGAYYTFMGLPMETSRGCTEKCVFCMVHVMQPRQYHTAAIELLEQRAQLYKGHFVNVIDYNFGVDKGHVIQVASILKKAGVTGWMAEMCIELLDDDELLQALQQSGCRIIYCGLESIDEAAIASVHKMHTNHIANYERIIRKAQSYGIQIAAGIILGMPGMKAATFDKLFSFYSRMGIVYAKLTYLTYNPGTRVHSYMRKKGEYLTDTISHYDGNHLTFLPTGVNEAEIYAGTKKFISRFYSPYQIIKRSFNTRLSFRGRAEYILFNFCYRVAYLQWIDAGVLKKDAAFDTLLNRPFKKNLFIQLCEWLLGYLRKRAAQKNEKNTTGNVPVYGNSSGNSVYTLPARQTELV